MFEKNEMHSDLPVSGRWNAFQLHKRRIDILDSFRKLETSKRLDVNQMFY